ncbi:MAG: hypothetical protein COB85_04590, partial [Bacteroidetes bacterium]
MKFNLLLAFILIGSTAFSQTLSVFVSASGETSCGACDGTATAIVFGGSPPYTYLWNDPASQTTSIATGLCPGNYTVYVVDMMLNIDSASADVIAAASTMILSSSSTDESSCGACDGSTAVSVSGGVPPYTFIWDDPSSQSDSIATGLCPGIYTVTVIDSNSCQDTISASVGTSGGSGMTLSVTTMNNTYCMFSCNGSASVSVTGGNTPLMYAWNDPANQTNSTATSLCSGTYNITVTDSLGCSEVTTATIADSSDLAATISFTNESSCGACDGSATANVTGGIPPYGYQWNDPLNQTTAIATGLCAGTYDVIIGDSSTCFITESVTVGTTGGSGMTLTASGNDASCGVCDGTASVSVAGGVSPLSYSWNTNPIQTTSSITGLCPGTYVVTVTDSNLCSEDDTVVVGGGVSFTLATNAVNESACGAGDGEASVTVTGGTGPFTYLWDDPLAQTTDTAFGLSEGTYTVIVTDGSGCMDSATATVMEPGNLVAIISGSTNTSCTACDGDATLTAFLGTPPYTYLWDDSNAQTNLTATGLCAGTYSFVVTDDASCTETGEVTIAQAAGPTAFITNVNDATCGNCDGVIGSSAFGGSIPYTYIWNDPLAQSTDVADSLCPGNYTVIVTDNNGCSDSTSAVVSNIGGPTATISSTTDVSCNGGNNGSATVSANGGAAPYVYLWDDPA